MADRYVQTLEGENMGCQKPLSAPSESVKRTGNFESILTTTDSETPTGDKKKASKRAEPSGTDTDLQENIVTDIDYKLCVYGRKGPPLKMHDK